MWLQAVGHVVCRSISWGSGMPPPACCEHTNTVMSRLFLQSTESSVWHLRTPCSCSHVGYADVAVVGYVVSSRVSSSWLFICVGAGSVRRLDNAWKSEARTHKSALWERTVRLCRSLVCHRFCRLVAFPRLLSESWFLTPNISRSVSR